MNKTNNPRKSPNLGTSDEAKQRATCEQSEDNSRLLVIRRSLESCWSSCSPMDHPRVRHYLELDSGPDFVMVDAWRRCGRNDLTRTMKLDVGPQIRRTMTPLGFACLIAYCQAWLDAAEARAALTGQAPKSSSPPADDGSRRPCPGRGSAARGPGSGTRSRSRGKPRARPKTV